MKLHIFWETNSWKIVMFMSLNSWGHRSFFRGVCKCYYICNDSSNTFY
jgi:hypothetical protein